MIITAVGLGEVLCATSVWSSEKLCMLGTSAPLLIMSTQFLSSWTGILANSNMELPGTSCVMA